jgi:pilus assembly protein CpaB
VPDGRSRVLLVVGLALAVTTGVLLYNAASRPIAAQDGLADRIDVLVARRDIAPQTVLNADLFEHRSYPAELVPPGTITDATPFVGQRNTFAIPQGVPLVRTQLVGTSQITSSIPDGSVVVAFPTTDALVVAGLVQAGDRIDILATLPSADGVRVTQTTVQNLAVVQVTRDQAVRSLVFVVDHQTALVLKYLRDLPTTIDIVVRSQSERGTARTQSVDITYLTQNFGLRPR